MEMLDKPTADPTVTSGTASEALLAAAESASSADTASRPATPVSGSPAAAIRQPGSGVTPPPAPDAKGPIPFDRHEAAIRNARTEVENRFGWAKDLNPEEAKQALKLLADLRRDPRAFSAELGRLLTPAGAKQAADLFPDGDLVSQDGKKAYSVDAMRAFAEVLKRQILADVQPLIQPLADDHRTRQEREHQQTVRAQSTSIATQALDTARALPHWKDNEPAIIEKMQQFPVELRNQIGPVAAMYQCYSQVLAEKVFPNYDAQAQASVQESNRRKAASSQGIHPTAAAPVPGKPQLRNVEDLALHMEQLERAHTG